MTEESEWIKVRSLAKHDQIEAGIIEISKLLGKYYTGLVESGIPKQTAKELTLDYQRLLYFSSIKNNG